jgi:hypothetical protein
MAHECPDCGLSCHCGGDIDDIMFPDSKYAVTCTCCDRSEDEEEYYDDYDYDYDDEAAPQ